LPNGTYKFSVEGNYELLVQWRDPANPADGVAQDYENLTEWITSGEVTLDKSTGGYGIVVRKTSGSSTITLNNFDGTLFCYKASDIQTANVEALLGVGDYKDTQEVVSGLIGRKVGIYVFTGEEAFTKGSAFYTTNTSFLPSKAGGITPICTHFRGISSSAARVANSLTMTVNGPSGTYTGCVYFYADRSLYATAADFKAWLASRYAAGDPVIVIYPLETPTTEQTEAQYLETTAGKNVITDEACISNPQIHIIYKTA
jgi:hypothetical protein